MDGLMGKGDEARGVAPAAGAATDGKRLGPQVGALRVEEGQLGAGHLPASLAPDDVAEAVPEG